MTMNLPATLTIGRLARAAGVGIETVRYYQERALLPVPPRIGGFRHYPSALVNRIRFVKRAQDLGFTLNEIADLLSLQDGLDRRSIRRITTARLEQIRIKLAELTRMSRTLKHLLRECEQGEPSAHCPIVESLATDDARPESTVRRECTTALCSPSKAKRRSSRPRSVKQG